MIWIKQFLDFLQQLLRAFGLGQEDVGIFHALGNVSRAGEKNDRNTGFQPLHFGGHNGASGASHEVIGNYEINLVGLKQVQAFLSRRARNNFVALTFQDQRAEVQARRFVVHAKDRRAERG